MRQDTLLFLLKPESAEVLLAMKKRGLGAGKFNGVGGKVEPGETIEAAAVREAHEEIGVTVDPGNLKKVAEIDFSHEGKPEWDIHGHVFLTDRWEGSPVESEEMLPQWFTISDIPYDQMWLDDEHWLPHVLAGKKLEASFRFSNDGARINEQSVKLVP